MLCGSYCPGIRDDLPPAILKLFMLTVTSELWQTMTRSSLCILVLYALGHNSEDGRGSSGDLEGKVEVERERWRSRGKGGD